MKHYMLRVKYPTSLTEGGKLYQPIKFFYGKTKEEAEFKYRKYLKASSEEASR